MEVNGHKIEPGAQLAGADLAGANLEGANLVSANLQSANLEGANLGGANLVSANLQSANLEGANLEGANLVSANLKSANLEGANLEGANLVSANLQSANLKDANLTNANLVSANLKRANLGGANLTNTDLFSADLRGTNLPNEDLGSADKSYTHWFDDQAGANSGVVIQNQIYGELSPELVSTKKNNFPAAWHTDPFGRFELRYWNGEEWTEHVVHEGRQLTDSPQPITQGNKSSEKETSTFWARLKKNFENYGGPLRESECPDCGSTYLIRIPISAPIGGGPEHAGQPACGERMQGLRIECRNCGYWWYY